MKLAFCISALVSVSVALAVPFQNHQAFVKRQSSVDANAPAMSDANGNVVPFDTAGVHLDAAAKGL